MIKVRIMIQFGESHSTLDCDRILSAADTGRQSFDDEKLKLSPSCKQRTNFELHCETGFQLKGEKKYLVSNDLPNSSVVKSFNLAFSSFVLLLLLPGVVAHTARKTSPFLASPVAGPKYPTYFV
jgi:hypothetical protein